MPFSAPGIDIPNNVRGMIIPISNMTAILLILSKPFRMSDLIIIKLIIEIPKKDSIGINELVYSLKDRFIPNIIKKKNERTQPSITK
jgi:hypothetical protein